METNAAATYKAQKCIRYFPNINIHRLLGPCMDHIKKHVLNCQGITEVLLVVGGICNNRRLHHTEYYSAKRGWQPLADISTAHGSMHSYRLRRLTKISGL